MSCLTGKRATNGPAQTSSRLEAESLQNVSSLFIPSREEDPVAWQLRRCLNPVVHPPFRDLPDTWVMCTIESIRAGEKPAWSLTIYQEGVGSRRESALFLRVQRVPPDLRQRTPTYEEGGGAKVGTIDFASSGLRTTYDIQVGDFCTIDFFLLTDRTL